MPKRPLALLGAWKETFRGRKIPWGHNREIITKCNDVHEALFYVEKTAQNNWSRAVLLMQMESKLYHREGKAINNFALTLPQLQADLAIEILKNLYSIDFLTLGHSITNARFILELEQYFAFIDSTNIIISGDDFRIDLLFFYTKRCRYI